MTAACDTSLLVPTLNPRHPAHAEALEVWPELTAVPTHVLLETYSVLTRVQLAYQMAGRDVLRALDGLGLEVIGLPESRQAELVADCAAADVVGGAVYDGLVGLTARHHDVTLITRDRRARETYAALGVRYRLI
ncbi:PIN domain-containing protein [Nocardioides nitrophenolicus]|uniref:PIN domain-containing protein n=1 Tax=Nocardioides nitrophenolicus TaxID=60489 RepID=UPI00195654DD|nr:PIN domain-containing protein [Nocardioides nitrophenolicus]MBM7517410.1 putative nucleic acid-binding protein [Nocardioides nitrophenolicus]